MRVHALGADSWYFSLMKFLVPLRVTAVDDGGLHSSGRTEKLLFIAPYLDMYCFHVLLAEPSRKAREDERKSGT